MGLFKPYWMKENMAPEKAAAKLDNESQDMLRQIALEAPDRDMVLAAIKRIKDQGFIKRFILDRKKPVILIFLPVILIPACASSSPEFLMTYSVYKLNKQVTIYSLDVLLFLFGTSL